MASSKSPPPITCSASSEFPGRHWRDPTKPPHPVCPQSPGVAGARGLRRGHRARANARFAGQFLSRTLWLSLDPYYRNVMKNSQIYADRLAAGDVMVGETVAQVVTSQHGDCSRGDYVAVRNGWQQYALSNGQGVAQARSAVAPVSTALGVLGMPGLTGYAGTVYLGEPRPGQTFVVSACTGPVGSTAGQVARHMGARVVGIAGSTAKCDYAVRELGFAACVNYREGDLATQLKQACPDGIDVYFDNVAGDTLVAVLRNLALGARIVLCGMIEAYSMDKPPAGPFLGPVVGARATMKGLVVYDHLHRLPELVKVVGGWIREAASAIGKTSRKASRRRRRHSVA
ncbi:MAG: NADP-dependent oxidoreductase [Steroidobacteraceae bacterium]